MAQCAALGQLFAGLTSQSAGFLEGTSWTQMAAGGRGDYCTLAGVTCDSLGHITELDLGGKLLAGTLPAGVAANRPLLTLSHLQALRLNGNYIQGLAPWDVITQMTRLQVLDLSFNMMLGQLPASLANLTALQSLLLESNVFSGPIPDVFASIPRLQTLDLASNFFTGAVPASLAQQLLPSLGGTGQLAQVSLASNLLASTGFPRALCPFMCVDGIGAFMCPMDPATCSECRTRQSTVNCIYNACPVDLPTASFAPIVQPCATPSLASACLSCLPAITKPFLDVGLFDAFNLGNCIRGHSPKLVAAGGNGITLGLVANCSTTFGYNYNGNTCPITTIVSPSNFSAVAVACTDPAYTCTVCLSAILNVYVRAGLPLRDYGLRFTLQDFYTIQDCISQHLGLMLTAGVAPSVLAGVTTCSRPAAPYNVTAALLLYGVARLDFSQTNFTRGLSNAAGVHPLALSVLGAEDPSTDAILLQQLQLQPAALSAASPAVLVRFFIGLSDNAERVAVNATLVQASANGSMVAALQYANVDRCTSARLYLGLGQTATAMPPAPAALPVGRKASGLPPWRTGAIAGGVVGGTVLAAAAAATVCVTAAASRRRRQGGELQQKLSRGASDFSVAVGHADDPSYASMESKPEMSQETYGWRAVVTTAQEVTLGECIGDGVYASVYSATWRGSEVAVKIWGHLTLGAGAGNRRDPTVTDSNSNSGSSGAPPSSEPFLSDMTTVDGDFSSSYIREVTLLSGVRHPHILAIFAVVPSPPMLVMEVGKAGSLRDLLARTSLANLGWIRRLSIARGIACGVEFLHAQEPPIIHSDLKPGNIVLDEALVPKVADFGISSTQKVRHGPGYTVKAGTPLYMPPEVLRGEIVTDLKAVDAYGLGMVVYDMVRINTDAGAEARLAKMGVDPSKAVSETVSAETTRRWNAIQLLYAREQRNFATEIPPQCPATLGSLVLEALSTAPAARPTLTQLRERLGRLTGESQTW